jgi:hypothetical protein
MKAIVLSFDCLCASGPNGLKRVKIIGYIISTLQPCQALDEDSKLLVFGAEDMLCWRLEQCTAGCARFTS